MSCFISLNLNYFTYKRKDLDSMNTTVLTLCALPVRNVFFSGKVVEISRRGFLECDWNSGRGFWCRGIDGTGIVGRSESSAVATASLNLGVNQRKERS